MQDSGSCPSAGWGCSTWILIMAHHQNGALSMEYLYTSGDGRKPDGHLVVSLKSFLVTSGELRWYTNTITIPTVGYDPTPIGPPPPHTHYPPHLQSHMHRGRCNYFLRDRGKCHQDSPKSLSILSPLFFHFHDLLYQLSLLSRLSPAISLQSISLERERERLSVSEGATEEQHSS